MKSNAPGPTKLESERIDKMLQLGCAACAFLGVPNLVNTECHHLLDGNVRLGHWFSIPLCAGHHRGAWTEGQLTWIEAHQRVAISDGRKAFTRIYPTEWQLWDRVQIVLRLENDRPISKLIPRKMGADHGV
jgi:Recombination enhancement, RecA-dependent nuclease